MIYASKSASQLNQQQLDDIIKDRKSVSARKCKSGQAPVGNTENSEEEDSDDESESPVHRKKRGLKILSVKVRELVEEKGSTTYKDVANELIKQLRENSKSSGNGNNLSDYLVGEISEDGGDDEDMSDESPNKKLGASGSKKDGQDHSLQKWEKNVRRRVYDALNVLYAAGVLRKDGKHVSCDPKAIIGSKEENKFDNY